MNVDEARYGPVFAAAREFDPLHRIWEEAYGSQYMSGIEPFGFLGTTDFFRLVQSLHLSGSTQVIDLGCGTGGPGLWVASTTGARLTGIDLVPAAIARARARALEMGLDREASFEVASMTATGRPTGSHEAALAIDSMWMVHDKRAAAGEVARILEAEAPFALTTWEPPYLSYADLLESAGFEIDDEWEPDDWLTPQLAVYRGILEASETLRGHLGDEAAAVLIEEATDTSATLASVRRVCITARRIRDLPRTTETSTA